MRGLTDLEASMFHAAASPQLVNLEEHQLNLETELLRKGYLMNRYGDNAILTFITNRGRLALRVHEAYLSTVNRS